MQEELSIFLARVESIQRNIGLYDQLITFGQLSAEDVPIAGIELHRIIRDTGQSGMQSSLNGSVLLLSAALEQFINDVILAFAQDIPNLVPDYKDLPKKLRDANEQMTGEALSIGRYRRRFSDYQRQSFVENLSNCQNGTGGYMINGEVLALHHSNMGPETLGQLTGRLGIENVWRQIVSTDYLKEWAKRENVEPTQSHAQNQLKELIDTRNQIAHRVGVADPGPRVVRSFVDFERALARSLVAVLSNHADSLASMPNPPSE